MRLLFDMVCLAVAGVAAHAGTSALAVGQFESPTNRHLRVHEPAHGNKEERVASEIFELFESAVSKHSREEIDTLESEPNAKRLKMDTASTSDHPNLLKLDQRTSKKQDRVIFNNWRQEMKTLLKEKQPLLKSLKEKYGDNRLIKIISSAKRRVDTKAYGLLVEALLKQMDPDKFLLEIELKAPDVRRLFGNIEFRIWVEYVDCFNREYPEKAKSIRQRLLKYSDVELIDMLYHVSTMPRRSKIGLAVLGRLTDSWLRMNYSPVDVFNLLGLHVAVKDIEFSSPRFTEWMQYVTEFNAKFGTRVSYSSALTEIYKDDDLLVEALKAAGNSPRIKRLALDFERFLMRQVTGPNEAENLSKLRAIIGSIKQPAEGVKLSKKYH